MIIADIEATMTTCTAWSCAGNAQVGSDAQSTPSPPASPIARTGERPSAERLSAALFSCMARRKLTKLAPHTTASQPAIRNGLVEANSAQATRKAEAVLVAARNGANR